MPLVLFDGIGVELWSYQKCHGDLLHSENKQNTGNEQHNLRRRICAVAGTEETRHDGLVAASRSNGTPDFTGGLDLSRTKYQNIQCIVDIDIF